jgi:epoxyqueuosine reductase
MDKELIINIAHKNGFDIAGFAPYCLLEDEYERLNDWLDKGFHASMAYMENNTAKRRDVKNILPSVNSVISLGINYYNKQREIPEDMEQYGKVSVYARGDDYHYVIWDKLKTVTAEIRQLFPELEAVSYVDTGPVMDKVWALRGGLGWMGKHSCVISPLLGSWFFIANIFTNIEFENYSILQPDRCGTCTRCIDACPTQAITDKHVIDSNRCISFLTIENKGDIPEKFEGKFQNMVFGCDICQSVCPWNKKLQHPASDEELNPNEAVDFIDRNEAENMTSAEFKEKFSRSPIARTKLKGLKRNCRFC